MDINLISIFAILASFFGGIGLSANNENKNIIMLILGVSGLLALGLCAFTLMGRMSNQQCEQYQSLCEINAFYIKQLKFPTSNEALSAKLFITYGWWGAISLYLIMALARAKKIRYKILSFLGATTLAIVATFTLYGEIIA